MKPNVSVLIGLGVLLGGECLLTVHDVLGSVPNTHTLLTPSFLLLGPEQGAGSCDLSHRLQECSFLVSVLSFYYYF